MAARWRPLGAGVWELPCATIVALVVAVEDPQAAPATPGSTVPPRGYTVALVVNGEHYEQGGEYETLVEAKVVAVAQAQAIITRAGAELRCALVDLHKEIAGG
jgi:hypothetical protein